MKRNIFLLFLFLITICTYSQIDLSNKLCVIENDGFKERESTMNKQIYNYLKMQQNSRRFSNVPLVIPVVFHVIHQNGTENVADSILIQELNALNAYFNNSNPNLGSTSSDVNIQFCLASVDPWGNPTNGVTRDSSAHADVDFTLTTNNSDDSMKNVNRWNPYRYLNIWIVRNVIGYANAYAALPTSLGQSDDGIVITASSLGGTHYLIGHETGHYLGLYHPDQGNSCVNFNCLLDGDQVCDTPPMINNQMPCPTNSCSTEMDDTSGVNPFMSDQMDRSTIMLWIYPCNLSITQGQSDRMNAALTQIRDKLVSSNGCGANPGTVLPVASFTHSPSCNLHTFINTSTNSEYVEWDFDNDGYYEAIGDTVTHVFTTSGFYTTKMRVFGQWGADEDSISFYVTARPSSIYPLQNMVGVGALNRVCEGTTVTLNAIPGMTSYLWNTGDTTQSISFVADSSFQITLRCTDTAAYVWEFCPDTIMYFEVYEYPQQPIITNLSPDSVCQSDSVRVQVNLAPGEYIYKWELDNFTIYYSPDSILTINPITGTNTVSVTVALSTCMTSSAPIQFYADTVPAFPYTLTQTGNTLNAYSPSWNNQFYVDGVMIPGATQSTYTVTQQGCYSAASWFMLPQCQIMSDTICFLHTDIVNVNKNNAIFVFPNPSSQQITVRIAGTKNQPLTENVFIRNIYGQKMNVALTIIDAENILIDLSKLAGGNYILSMDNYRQMIIKAGN